MGHVLVEQLWIASVTVTMTMSSARMSLWLGLTLKIGRI
jgi:hypothetical protein